MSQKNVFIFCIARELLEGGVLDRNAHFLAHHISQIGFKVQTIQVLDDVEEDIVAAFQAALARKPAFIITTGGMGPGYDDLTRECIAKATGLPLEQNEEAVNMLGRAYRKLVARGLAENAELNEDRLVMAQLPKGASCFENPMGTAPAVRLKAGDTDFFSLPGVPAEMQRMFELYVGPALIEDGPGVIKMARYVEWPGGDESSLKRILTDINRRYPGIHTRARVMGEGDSLCLRVGLYGEHTDEKELGDLLEKAEDDLRARLGLEVTRSDQA